MDWRLSDDIRQGIRQHHNCMADVAPESLSGILQISEYLIFRLKVSAFPEVTMALSPPLLLHMKGNIREYRAIAEDLPDELHKAEEIYGLEND